MLALKLCMELFALVILAVGLRKLLTRSMASHAHPEDGMAAARLKGEWQWFTVIHLVLGLMLSIVIFWLIYAVFSILHSIGQYSSVLITSQGGLIVPSLIFGFLRSNLFSRSVYLDLFGMNSAIFQRKNIAKWRQLFGRIFNLFIFAIGILLLAIQFKVYLKTDGENIYVGKLKGQEKIYAVDDIKKVASNSSHAMDIHMRNGEKVSTRPYSGNLNYFLDNL